MPNYYCKHCGTKYQNLQNMLMSGCSKSPTRKHELYEGSEKSKYTCKYCGVSMQTLQSLVISTCHKSPSKHHEAAL
ncbi:hypothetical protein R83H12_02998 [Fibrobacteria bacterium R8-3-H12]